jgi:hypothetical protein
MAAARQRPPTGSSDEPATALGRVLDLEARRIVKALARRIRYRYVQPHVQREGLGWKVVSPNCSRNIDPAGGDIDIAWLVPTPAAGWQLFARNHALAAWELRLEDSTLAPLLERLCLDPQREFWV